jgi:hypothetical protein
MSTDASDLLSAAMIEALRAARPSAEPLRADDPSRLERLSRRIPSLMLGRGAVPSPARPARQDRVAPD